MKMIVAVDRNWGIGKDGDLLVHIPEDMNFFKSKTTGNVVVMGRKTFESFPGKKALPDRVNLVLTRNPEWTGDGAQCVSGRDALEAELGKYTDRDVYIIGGGQIYREYLPDCDRIYVTHIDADYQADTWFPNLEEEAGFEKGEVLQTGEWKGIGFTICEWNKIAIRG